MSQKILLLTKNYPPQIGGIEKYSLDLYDKLIREWNQVKLIAAKPRNEYLLTKFSDWWYIEKFFYIVSEIFRLVSFTIIGIFYGTLWCIANIQKSWEDDEILIWSADGSIAWLGLFISKFSLLMSLPITNWTCKTRVTGHGKDISWNHYFYRKILKFSFQNTDEIYVVSRTIKDLVLKIWIPERKITIQEHSLTNLHFSSPWIFNKELFLQKYNIPRDKILLFSIGRFVEKKWFHWFVAEILPFLSNRFFYVLAGDGPFWEKIKKIITEKWLNNILLIWMIKDSVEKARLYSIMNYFIMPNIFVQWDCEGFGIVLLEAQSYNLKCIVSGTDWLETRIWIDDIVLPREYSEKWIAFFNHL